MILEEEENLEQNFASKVLQSVESLDIFCKIGIYRSKIDYACTCESRKNVKKFPCGRFKKMTKSIGFVSEECMMVAQER